MVIIEEFLKLELTKKLSDNGECFAVGVKIGEICENSEIEPILEGHIKWDGCSNLMVGLNDLYAHFCGFEDFLKLVKMVELAYSESKNLFSYCDY